MGCSGSNHAQEACTGDELHVEGACWTLNVLSRESEEVRRAAGRETRMSPHKEEHKPGHIYDIV